MQLSRRKLWTFRLVSIAIPLLLGAGFVVYWLNRPIYVVVEGYGPETGLKFIFDEELGWRNIPNRRATTLGAPLTFNSHGLRDKEYDYDKPEGTRRILVLGDSFAWGLGVADKDLFTEVLERKISPPWEVLNSGVSGWGTDQEFLFLQRYGFRYQPDVVVLAFYLGNDPMNNSVSLMYGLNKPVFVGTKLRLSNVPVPRPGKKPLTVAPMSTEQQLQITYALFKAINKACRDHGCPLVIMKFGNFVYEGNSEFARFEQQYKSSFAREFPELGEKTNLYYFDLDQRLEARRGEREIVMENDSHWNVYGHRLTGEILEEFLRESGLLK